MWPLMEAARLVGTSFSIVTLAVSALTEPEAASEATKASNGCHTSSPSEVRSVAEAAPEPKVGMTALGEVGDIIPEGGEDAADGEKLTDDTNGGGELTEGLTGASVGGGRPVEVSATAPAGGWSTSSGD